MLAISARCELPEGGRTGSIFLMLVCEPIDAVAVVLPSETHMHTEQKTKTIIEFGKTLCIHEYLRRF